LAAQFKFSLSKRPSLKLKTLHKQLLRIIPLVITHRTPGQLCKKPRMGFVSSKLISLIIGSLSHKINLLFHYFLLTVGGRQLPITQNYNFLNFFVLGMRNGTARFKKCKQLSAYQHFLLLRDICWSKLYSVFKYGYVMLG